MSHRRGRIARILIGLLVTLELFGVWTNPAAAKEAAINAEAAIVVDLDSGQELYGKNADRRMAPASTTKVLTALIALERGNLSDEVTISDNAPRVAGTRVYLVAGEKQTLENLLYAMMLNSGNDAAIAVAEHIAGSVEAFAVLMNEKAMELGANNSNFVNPHGLSDPNHYTTAADLAKISVAAMKNPTFREIVATRTRPWRGAEWETNLVNHNKLLGSYEGAIGVKNGYTSEAGQCLVAAAARGEEGYLAVALNSSSRELYADVTALLDYAFDNFQADYLVQAGQVIARVATPGGKEAKLVAAGNYRYLKQADSQWPVTSLKVGRLVGPVAPGDKVGEIVFSVENREIGKVDLLVEEAIPRVTSWADWWLRISGGALLLFVLVNLGRQRRVRRRRNMYSTGRSRRLRFR